MQQLTARGYSADISLDNPTTNDVMLSKVLADTLAGSAGRPRQIT